MRWPVPTHAVSVLYIYIWPWLAAVCYKAAYCALARVHTLASLALDSCMRLMTDDVDDCGTAVLHRVVLLFDTMLSKYM